MMSGLTVATMLTIFFVPALYAAWFTVQRQSQTPTDGTCRRRAGARVVTRWLV
jgi:hypothetical protein